MGWDWWGEGVHRGVAVSFEIMCACVCVLMYFCVSGGGDSGYFFVLFQGVPPGGDSVELGGGGILEGVLGGAFLGGTLGQLRGRALSF